MKRFFFIKIKSIAANKLLLVHYLGAQRYGISILPLRMRKNWLVWSIDCCLTIVATVVSLYLFRFWRMRSRDCGANCWFIYRVTVVDALLVLSNVHDLKSDDFYDLNKQVHWHGSCRLNFLRICFRLLINKYVYH